MTQPYQPPGGNMQQAIEEWYNRTNEQGRRKMLTVVFWKDLFERVVATLAQVALGLLASDGAASVPAKVWVTTLLVAGAGVVLKALVAAYAVTDAVSPASLVKNDPKDLL